MREDGGRIVLMDLGTGREVGSPSEARRTRISPARRCISRRRLFERRARRASAPTSTVSACFCITSSPAFSRSARRPSTSCAKGTSAGRLVRLRDARPDLPTAFVRVVDRAIAARCERAVCDRRRVRGRSRPRPGGIYRAWRRSRAVGPTGSRFPGAIPFVTIGVTAALVCIVALGVWLLQRGSGVVTAPTGTVRPRLQCCR